MCSLAHVSGLQFEVQLMSGLRSGRVLRPLLIQPWLSRYIVANQAVSQNMSCVCMHRR